MMNTCMFRYLSHDYAGQEGNLVLYDLSHRSSLQCSVDIRFHDLLIYVQSVLNILRPPEQVCIALYMNGPPSI